MNNGLSSPIYPETEHWTSALESAPEGEKPPHADAARLKYLAEIILAPREENPIDKILQIGCILSGADSITMYLADERSPFLKRSESKGDVSHLPESLPAQELVSLNKPLVWVTGKRPLSILQRTARAANLAYLASAPLGQENAAIGLIALYGGEAPDKEVMLSLVKLLADALTIALQHQFLRAQSQSFQQTVHTQMLSAQAIERYSREGIILLSPEYKILRLNPSAEIMLGYNSREIAGQPVEYVLIGNETLDQILNEAREGKPVFYYDQEQTPGNVRLYRRSGEDFLALVRVFPLLEAEQVQSILIFIQDLSEQEHIRNQTQQLEQRALLGEVIASFSHEVRNPVNNISTGLQLLAMNLGEAHAENDPNQARIAGMLQDCDRLDELLKGVLAFSRPTEYAMEPLDLAEAVRRLLERLHPRITRLNVQYNLHVQPGCPLILGNLHALEQVFNNLINNALKAMGEAGGRLVIKIQHQQANEQRKYVEVSVADTGRGIPIELQERIFQPFFTTEQGGTGLGLAISKRIVTAHKGNIRVESFPGGSVFYVQLPAANPTVEVI